MLTSQVAITGCGWAWGEDWAKRRMLKTLQPLLSDAARSVLIGAIRLYQVTLSPFFGPCCRYTPSCSHYGIEAIRCFGALRGGWLTLWRVLRCNPWGGAGDDPVPDRGTLSPSAFTNHKSPTPTAAMRRAMTAERTRS